MAAGEGGEEERKNHLRVFAPAILAEVPIGGTF